MFQRSKRRYALHYYAGIELSLPVVIKKARGLEKIITFFMLKWRIVLETRNIFVIGGILSHYILFISLVKA